MTSQEIEEIISKGTKDGRELYRVVDLLHKISLIAIGIYLVLGLILAGAAIADGQMIAFLVVVVVIFFLCAITYIASILCTNGAKILVHLLFANLVIMNRGLK